MGLGTLLGRETLKELIRLSPQLIETAQQVFATVSRNRRQGNEQDAAIQGRIEKLEAADVAQAELLSRMVEQSRALSQVVDSITRRLRTITLLAAGALVLSLILGIILLVR